MKTITQMNFLVDKENKKITVERAFNAPVEMVWEAWTNPEILDQWWAPKPWKAESKYLNFKEGGRWLYAMVGPKGEKQWCLFDYASITPGKNFSGSDAFCNENENIDTSKPKAYWSNDFVPNGETTMVNIEIGFDDVAGLETQINMGFKEGFTMGLENLDQYLSQK